MAAVSIIRLMFKVWTFLAQEQISTIINENPEKFRNFLIFMQAPCIFLPLYNLYTVIIKLEVTGI